MSERSFGSATKVKVSGSASDGKARGSVKVSGSASDGEASGSVKVSGSASDGEASDSVKVSGSASDGEASGCATEDNSTDGRSATLSEDKRKKLLEMFSRFSAEELLFLRPFLKKAARDVVEDHSPIPFEGLISKFVGGDYNGDGKYAVYNGDGKFVQVPKISKIEDFTKHDILINNDRIFDRIVESSDLESFIVGKSYATFGERFFMGVENRFSSTYRIKNYFHFILLKCFLREEDALAEERRLYDKYSEHNKMDPNAKSSPGRTASKEKNAYVVYLALKLVASKPAIEN